MLKPWVKASAPSIKDEKCHWISCHRLRTWILLTLWLKIILQYDFVVILHVLPFQVQMSHWISFHRPHTWILFALCFKTMILHVLQFQLQMSNWITFHRPHTWILFALWFKTALQNDFVVILHDLLHDLKSRCQIEPFAAVLTMKSYLLFDSKLLFKMALWW